MICFDAGYRVQRIEPSGVRFAAEVGHAIAVGDVVSPSVLQAMAERMADRLLEAVSVAEQGEATTGLLRLPKLSGTIVPDAVQFSGGVSEFIYGRQAASFGDLGEMLAAALRARISGWVTVIETPAEGIRATVIGASQYTVQVSGSTIFIDPPALLPVRNIAVIAPAFDLSGEAIDPAEVAAAGHPLILVGDGDIGGLVGIHVNAEARLGLDVISIDGIDIKEFDFIDIGAILSTSGAVPVVIKSLVFPGAGLGRPVAMDQ